MDRKVFLLVIRGDKVGSCDPHQRQHLTTGLQRHVVHDAIRCEGFVAKTETSYDPFRCVDLTIHKDRWRDICLNASTLPCLEKTHTPYDHLNVVFARDLRGLEQKSLSRQRSLRDSYRRSHSLFPVA